MFHMMLLLILLVGITFTLLGRPDHTGKAPISARLVLSSGSSALLWAV